jgi:hypothetical protein
MPTREDACEVHQQEIEQRAWGALDAEGVAGLEAHLAGCVTCQAWAQQVRQSTQAQRAMVNRAVTTFDWAQLERHVSGERAMLKQEWVMVALGVGLTDVSNLLVFGWDFVRPAAPLVLLVEVLALLAFGWRERRALDRQLVGLSEGALFDWLTKQAAWRRSGARFSRGLIVAAAVGVGASLGFIDGWSPPTGDPLQLRFRIAAGLLCAGLLGLLLWVQLHVLPRAEREWAALKGER